LKSWLFEERNAKKSWISLFHHLPLRLSLTPKWYCLHPPYPFSSSSPLSPPHIPFPLQHFYLLARERRSHPPCPRTHINTLLPPLRLPDPPLQFLHLSLFLPPTLLQELYKVSTVLVFFSFRISFFVIHFENRGLRELFWYG